MIYSMKRENCTARIQQKLWWTNAPPCHYLLIKAATFLKVGWSMFHNPDCKLKSKYYHTGAGEIKQFFASQILWELLVKIVCVIVKLNLFQGKYWDKHQAKVPWKITNWFFALLTATHDKSFCLRCIFLGLPLNRSQCPMKITTRTWKHF